MLKSFLQPKMETSLEILPTPSKEYFVFVLDSLKRFLVIVSMDALQRFFVVNNLKYVVSFPCALFRDYQDNYFNS